MELAKFYNLACTVIIWAIALYIVKPGRIVEYIPVGLWGLGLMAADNIIHRAWGIHWYTTAYAMIAGIPLFQYLFGFGASIIMGYIVGRLTSAQEKIAAVVGFTAVDSLFFYSGVFFRSVGINQNFTFMHKVISDLILFSAFVLIADIIIKRTVRRELRQG